jgi:predicted amidophosphoribosyltransferase
MVCKNCGQPVDREHRFCPWCAAPQQRKAVALFPAHPEVRAPGAGLRVSRYFDPADGPPHTRVSVYDETGRVTAVVALDDATALALAQFLLGLGAETPLSVRRRVLDRVVDRLTSG